MRTAAVVAAAATQQPAGAVDEDSEESALSVAEQGEGSDDDDGGLSSVLAPGMVAPSVRLQPKLTPKERKAKRAEAEQRARDGTLVQVTVRMHFLCG
jgi:hypothetical protein